MPFQERVPDQLFDDKGHYLGRPADFNDRIIERKLRLVYKVPGFIGKEYTLMDIGCGNGAYMLRLADKMKSCIGMEISDEHLSQFNEYMNQHHISNSECKIINIEKNDPPMVVDRLLSFEVIEHLTTEDSLSFYYKALKKDGLMVITVPNKWWIFETHGANLPLLPWNRVPFFSWLPRAIHERYANARIYTKERIVRLLEKHGFTVLTTEYVTAPMDMLPKGAFKNFVIKYFFNSDTTRIPFKSTSIFVVARK